jgi:L-ascorbate metabolism protein UlaG (beta-lactamase superfamily)
MQINWYGHSCFRLRSRKGTVVTDPYGDGIGYSLPRVRADIVTVSHDHPHHASVKAIKGKPKIISGPGEYEIKGIFIIGIPTSPDARRSELEVRNIIYLFDLDGVTVCHLGDLRRVPTQAQVEELSDVDVLLIPVGGSATIGAAKASDVISLLEPKIVIPMHYRTKALKGSKLQPVDPFLKEMGTKGIEPQDMLKVTKGGLPTETQVVIISRRG